VTQAGFAELCHTGEQKSARVCKYGYRTCEPVRAFYTTGAGPENILAKTKLNYAAARSRLRTASPTERLGTSKIGSTAQPDATLCALASLLGRSLISCSLPPLYSTAPTCASTRINASFLRGSCARERRRIADALLRDPLPRVRHASCPRRLHVFALACSHLHPRGTRAACICLDKICLGTRPWRSIFRPRSRLPPRSCFAHSHALHGGQHAPSPPRQLTRPCPDADAQSSCAATHGLPASGASSATPGLSPEWG
jgi:hypothetical protein